MSERHGKFPGPDSETDPERKAIRAAIIRLLGGAPLHLDKSDNLTVVNLAKEAGVKRGALTHRHTDLQDEFRARVAAMQNASKTDREIELEALLADAQERVEALTVERDQWRNAAKDFARVIQVLELEKGQLINQGNALRKQLEREESKRIPQNPYIKSDTRNRPR